LRGQTFCLTGTLSTIPRSRAQARIKALGGAVSSGVTKKITYLVAGESPGSKLATAEKLGTTILNEEQFLELMDAQVAGV
jgi:DNA ligase (NAD+)